MNQFPTPPPFGSKQPQPPKVSITPEMIKSFKTVTCDCGGQLFQSGLVVKKVSSIISPTGKEETYPLEVLICMNCHKVPNEINVMNMLPESILAKRTYVEPPAPTTTTKGKSSLSIVRDDEDDHLGGP